MIDEYTVVPAGHVKRNTLVGDLACSTAVFIPCIYCLSVFNVWREAFPESINKFSCIECKFSYREDVTVFSAHTGNTARICFSQRLFIRSESKNRRISADVKRQRSACNW